MKRKGFTLIEILVLLAITMTLMFIMTGPMRTLIQGIPHLQRDVETDTVISNIVRTISKDVAAASDASLIISDNEETTGILSLQTDQGNILYDFKEEHVTRSVGNADKEPLIWKIKYGHIDWQVTQRDKFKTVEITSSVNRKIKGKIRKMLKKSHLYFIGAALAAEEKI